MKRYIFALLLVLVMAISGAANLQAAEPAPQINPAWTFHSQNYGAITSGSYTMGISTINYVASFNGTAEIYRVQFLGENNSRTFVSRSQSDGTFSIALVGDASPPYIVKKFINNTENTTTNSLNGVLHKIQHTDWLSAAHNQDSAPPSHPTGGYVYYKYVSGTFGCANPCPDFMAVWFGITTNTNFFFQVTATWGFANCGFNSVTVPALSYGITGNLAQCPITYAIQNHAYFFQVSFDTIFGKWYVAIYDQTAGSYVLNTNVPTATGSYVVSQYAIEVDMEGSNPAVDGTRIPGSVQTFYQLRYWDCCGHTYKWVTIPQYTQTPDTPSNIYKAANWDPTFTYISSIDFY